MSDEERIEFEERFQDAVSASLKRVSVSDELRQKLLGRLQEESRDALPQGLSEEQADRFELKLARAVQKSQDWAPEDSVVLRTESTLSKEMGRNVLSERSVHAILDGSDTPPELSHDENSQSKLAYLKSLRSEIHRSTQELTAPESVKNNILKALNSEEPSARPKVVAFPNRAQWSRSLKALTSLAAAFALVFLTIFSSADAALANSVRADHKMCCDKALKVQPNGPPAGLKAMLSSKYGAVPSPKMDESWDLRISKFCQCDDGQPMVHSLYTRENEKGELESISFHFLPNPGGQRAEKYSLSEPGLHVVSDGDFPVVGWVEGNWVCTACSPELDALQLKALLEKKA